MISLHFPGKPFKITLIQAYAPTSNTEEAEVEQFYEDLQDFLPSPHSQWKNRLPQDRSLVPKRLGTLI